MDGGQISTEQPRRVPVVKTSWSRFVRQPQTVLLRKALFQIHLWAGVLAALYLCAIGITGSLLVFKDELMPRPARSMSAASSSSQCTPAILLEALGRAAAIRPGLDPVLASCPTQAMPFYTVALRPAAASTQTTVYLNPGSLQIAGENNQDSSWIAWVYRFHLELLLAHNGRQWNGVGASLLLVLVLSGLVLWWPGIARWKRAFTLNLNASWKRINWDLHSVAGIWTIAFTLIWATTTIYFAWPEPFERALVRFSVNTSGLYPEAVLTQQQATFQHAATVRLDLQALLSMARMQSPSSTLEGVYLGEGNSPLLTVYMARGTPGDYTRSDFVYFDRRTGQFLLTWHRGINRTLTDWLLWLAAPLHFGTSFGLAGKVLWAACGLVLPLLAITGLIMYWNRWLKKRVFRAN